ncbi:MAG: tRNA preQ1(34) S-adenosylmethionine ribosyltransferase-isomerase QueA [Ruminococcaceae bacterium]|nr:tRNA preQ1(34) S-adenosylmethionine ribosyltransferase-isomerase QueA [Oscillospiraceae bacterium]
MKTRDFYYELPEELIAQDPISDRSGSRLLVLDKKTGNIEHKIFKNIKDYLKKGDCLVLNNTRVIPARLFGTKIPTGAKIEFLLLKRVEKDIWEVILRPGRRALKGCEVEFGDGELKAKVIDVLDSGNRLVEFYYDGLFENVLDKLGQMPLPPYITHKLEDKERYQTVYSKIKGSAAAPTAGLHFTNELLEEIKNMGVNIAYITLHVGLGTFRPVKVDDVTKHKMHSEYYSIDKENADIINNAKRNGGRIISVGTTSTRVLETVADQDGILKEECGNTEIFIYPPYKFKIVDCLITNFHLPESTLLMLVSSLAGKENIDNAYKIAVEERYRFFSFGDAMFIC